MRRLFKWCFRLLLLTVALGALLLLSRNLLLRFLLEQRLGDLTGLQVIVGRVQIDLNQPRVLIQDIRFKNPAGLGNRPFLDLSRIEVRYDLGDLLSREFRIERLRVQAVEMNLTRGDDGRSTQYVLQQGFKAAAEENRTLFAPLVFTGAERAQFTLGRYTYNDYLQMNRSQEWRAGTNLLEIAATNLTTTTQFLELLQRVAREKGVQWPPLDPPVPASNSLLPP